MQLLNCIFGTLLNLANGGAGTLGALLAYHGITISQVIRIPQGMDDDGLILTGIAVLGYFGVASAGLALIGVIVLNFGYKSHKVFLGFPYGFVMLALGFMAVSGFILKEQAAKGIIEMYDRCCVEYEDCCVKDPDAQKNMDEMHRRYNCCAFEGPNYFVKLNKVNFPQSCCPDVKNEIHFRCSTENAYQAACKTKVNEEMNPYMITLEGYCCATAFLCGVVTALIVLMATLNIYMNNSD